jgi:hypothetical protein
MKNALTNLLSTLIVASALGCGRHDAAREERERAEEAAAQAASDDGAAREGAGGVPDGAPYATGEPSFTAQEGWTERAPSSAMRFKEFALGEGPDAPLVVVAHWPGGIGSVADNISRWTSAISTGPDDAPPVTQETVRDGLRITTVDGAGTMSIGMSDSPQAGRRMLAAFVDAPGGRFAGAYTIKVVADAAELTPWVASFETFLADL